LNQFKVDRRWFKYNDICKTCTATFVITKDSKFCYANDNNLANCEKSVSSGSNTTSNNCFKCAAGFYLKLSNSLNSCVAIAGAGIANCKT
jgi:uncharacterized paraquat-inducible protein A